MAQNLIQTIITDEQIAEASAALDVLERIFPDFIVLDVNDRRSIRRMGTRSEQFTRQTLIVGQENPKLVPETVGLRDAIADMAAYDRLFPLFSRLTRIHQCWEDSLLAMGSDAYDAALGIYLLLKAFGKSMGLDELRKGVGSLFAKSRRKAKALLQGE
ncbi:hypothetical protein LYSHEL_27240 [Lysobacter helvus]|uniref:Uncharacterized protein n=2 Tax=Lysobacteraceae TaxID=32033 RepID=A0ABM7Q8F6_9GAMM|nr:MULTISPECIES: hypothetical protein [Lysobacter]BCT93697.1 hypothetical protein LYSCAS_27210 [Lysobacter caseinilyticus]BCT96853.1 hypothetical protein LYSHEL_27240 [Lysobacter helvus]